MKPSNKLHFTGIFLIIMHLSGFIGMQFSVSRPLFEMLTPLNLIVSVILLLIFHSEFTKNFIWVGLSIAISGFLVEITGVQTDMIFGKYAYGQNLGFKIWDVPLLIGVNWWMLVYCFGVFTEKYFAKKLLIIKALITALGMVLLDILIEPVAILHDLWHWFGQHPPTQNYFAWFIFAFLFALAFHGISFKKKNPLAMYLLIAQVLFFGLHFFIK